MCTTNSMFILIAALIAVSASLTGVLGTLMMMTRNSSPGSRVIHHGSPTGTPSAPIRRKRTPRTASTGSTLLPFPVPSPKGDNSIEP